MVSKKCWAYTSWQYEQAGPFALSPGSQQLSFLRPGVPRPSNSAICAPLLGSLSCLWPHFLCTRLQDSLLGSLTLLVADVARNGMLKDTWILTVRAVVTFHVVGRGGGGGGRDGGAAAAAAAATAAGHICALRCSCPVVQPRQSNRASNSPSLSCFVDQS